MTAALSDAEYTAVASCFSGYDLERDCFLAWFERVVIPAMRAYRRPIRVLSVGAGPGLFDLRLAEAARAAIGGVRLDWTLVEPNPEQFALLRQNAARAADDRVALKPLLATWDAFRDQGPYDWILLSHVLYELRDRHAALSRIGGMLAPGGFATIFNESEEGGQYLLRQELLAETTGDTTHLVSTEHLDRLCRTLGLASRHAVLPMRLDVRPCLDPEDPAGNAFLALLLGCPVERIRPDVLRRARDLLRMLSVPDGSGARTMHQPGGVLLLAPTQADLPAY